MTTTTTTPLAGPLAGRFIGIPESRQHDLFAQMLHKRGATVVRCPLVAIRDTPDRGPVDDWLALVAGDGLDDMIWLTGEGVRRLLGFAERLGVMQPFVHRLAQARHIARGPKPGRELRKLGLKIDIAATTPTTAGVIDALSFQRLAARRVGVQLYGSEPNTLLMDFLADAGARPWPVAPYVYADAAEETRVIAFIDAMIAGRLDAVAFTSSPQVRRLFAVARKRQCVPALTQAMARTCVAAVGPLVAATLADTGVAVDIMPDSNYFMKPLVNALVRHLNAPPV